MKNSDMPAQPISNNETYGDYEYAGGLTKREAFAMAAMQGLCSDPNYDASLDLLSRDAACIADALLKALEKNNA